MSVATSWRIQARYGNIAISCGLSCIVEVAKQVGNVGEGMVHVQFDRDIRFLPMPLGGGYSDVQGNGLDGCLKAVKAVKGQVVPVCRSVPCCQDPPQAPSCDFQFGLGV